VGGDHRIGPGSWRGAAIALIRWAILATLLSVAGARAQNFVVVPDAHITYLGGVDRPEGTEGLEEVPPSMATVILFSGGFGFGGSALVRSALDAAPHARLVAFDSPGGRPLIAEEAADLIRARHLDTYVERYCASACTIAFAAGTVRSASPGARFAFHRAASIALEALSNIEFVRMERRWFVRGGISLSFGNRALHAPNLQPYMPGLDELVAAGYLHRIRGVPGIGYSLPPGDALFEEMHALEPQTAAILLAADRRRVAFGMAAERSHAITLDDAALVVDRWLSRSSDTAILALADATIAALSALDPASCMRWQVGLADQDAGFLAIPPALKARLLTAQAAVLRDANAYPMPLPAENYEDADTEIRAGIEAKYGKQTLANASTPEHAFDDPAKSCAASIAYLRGLRERPEGPSVLRWALAAG
jgi:hypothetical protein